MEGASEMVILLLLRFPDPFTPLAPFSFWHICSANRIVDPQCFPLFKLYHPFVARERFYL